MNIKFLAIPIMLGVLGGCATHDGQLYVDNRCVTCFNNPITGEAITYDKAEKEAYQRQNDPTKQQAETQASEIYRWHEKADVDTVRNRILDDLNWDFGYLPKKEDIGDDAFELATKGLWNADWQPGVFYDISDAMTHTYMTQKYPIFLKIKLYKDGIGTDVQLKVLHSPNVDANKIVKDIAHRFQRAIRS